MPAAAACELYGLADFGLLHGLGLRQGDANLEEVILYGRYLCRGVEDRFSVIAQVLCIGRGRGDAPHCTYGIHKIEAPEGVPVVCAVDEDVFTEEPDGIQRFYPGVIVFPEDGAHKAARCG